MSHLSTISLLLLILVGYSCTPSSNHSPKEPTTLSTLDSTEDIPLKAPPVQPMQLDSFVDARADQTYTLVTLGTQTWMAENLQATTFRNGDKIPRATSIKAWKKAGKNKQPAWCYYEQKEALGKQEGILYNWYAVMDERGLAPEGFHIPSDKEWETLDLFLGKENTGTQLKTTFGCEMEKNGTSYEGNGTNSSQFSGLPTGTRGWSGKYFNRGYSGYWWTTTEDRVDNSKAWYRAVRCSYGHLNHFNYSKIYGMSVRCLREG